MGVPFSRVAFVVQRVGLLHAVKFVCFRVLAYEKGEIIRAHSFFLFERRVQ